MNFWTRFDNKWWKIPQKNKLYISSSLFSVGLIGYFLDTSALLLKCKTSDDDLDADDFNSNRLKRIKCKKLIKKFRVRL